MSEQRKSAGPTWRRRPGKMEKCRAEIHSKTRKIDRVSGKQKLERINLDKSNYLH